MAGESDRSKTTLAIVSVIATALVGIAGAATTLLVSHDARSTARANRIYDRRASAYVDAIDTLEGHMKVLANLDWSQARGAGGFAYEDVKVDDETDRARIRSRLVAFGTPAAITSFQRVGVLDRNAFTWVLGEAPRQRSASAWREKTDLAIHDLRDGLTVFERRLNRELTS